MKFNENNLDLIRLFAATQVAINHLYYHFGLQKEDLNLVVYEIIRVSQYFPGVPIFFMISGYLISRAYEKNPENKNYFRNRILRLYPAAWMCLLVSLLFLGVTGNLNELNYKSFAIWLISEIIFIHIYSFTGFTEFGTGKLNGSLWTLPVEIQFYILIPILYLILKKINFSKRTYDISVITFLMILSFYYNLFIVQNNLLNLNDGIYKKISIMLLPNYFYMFGLGILFQKNMDKIKDIIQDNGAYWLLFYVITCEFLRYTKVNVEFGNNIDFPMFILLSFTTLSLAYTKAEFSYNLIGKNDISYGVYIYHMPIANLMIELNLEMNYITYAIGITLTYLSGILSWKLVERPFIKMKKKTININTTRKSNN